ncbi:OmpA family protein [Pseudogemmobacter sp. W21_MBD1_M6]|uniref:OmpA family protein n=1 Tax=Pseudogemmobacter sp. W21_MBD1_M6 TaxID=3240271 RepID=UPI003F9795D3
MTLRLLKTSTALVASLSLLLPSALPLMAQETVTGDAVPMICADGTELPCAEGIEAIPVPAEVMPDAAATTEEAAPAEEVAPVVEAPVVEEVPAAEVPLVEELPATDAPAAEAPVVEGVPIVEETAPVVDAAPAADAPVTEPVTETVTETPAPEAAPDAAPAEPAIVVEDPVAEPAPAEAAAEEPAADAIEEPAAEATAEPTPEPAAEPAAEAEAEAEVEVGTTEADAANPVETVEEPAPEAPSAAAAAAPAGEEPQADAPAPEVTTEVVTEETARSSSEDFATTADGTPTAAAPSKKGLSNFEKFLLLGTGAVIVGSLLKNGDKVVANTGDRVVVQRGDTLQVLKDDDTLLRRPGSDVTTETFNDGSTRSTILREDGSKVVTIRDARGTVLRRTSYNAQGQEYVIIDDTIETAPLPKTRPANIKPIKKGETLEEAALRRALEAEAGTALDRGYSLRQIRNTEWVRDMVPAIEVDAITFDTGSAAINPTEAKALSALGAEMRNIIAANPRALFLVEGHTDAVGSASSNLALSDRRAESVALALTEYFDVQPENLVVQGYGEAYLKVKSDGDARENRRVSVRDITPILQQVVASR